MLPCLEYREYGVCRNGSRCKKDHVKGKGVCQSKQYQDTGICTNFFNCKATRPWEEAKWGNKQEALKRARDARQQGQNSMMVNDTEEEDISAINIVMGKRNRIPKKRFSLLELEMMHLMGEDIPGEEFHAAFLDESFGTAEDSDTESGAESENESDNRFIADSNSSFSTGDQSWEPEDTDEKETDE